MTALKLIFIYHALACNMITGASSYTLTLENNSTHNFWIFPNYNKCKEGYAATKVSEI
jgi:hypothetical protein